MGDWWRKGLRVALVVIAVAAVGAMGACGGGDDDNDYNFNGTWTMNSLIVQSNLPGFPVGRSGIDTMKISQSGTSIAIGIAGAPLQNGSCDPGGGTFTAAGTVNGMAITTTGSAVDDNTITGQWTMSGGPYVVRATYTAELVSRSLAAAAQPGKAGFLGSMPQLLQ